MRVGHYLAGVMAVACALASAFSSKERSSNPVTVADCVQIRRIFDGQVALSPDGTAVAYVVKAPDIEANKNLYEVYLRDLKSQNTKRKANGRLLLKTERALRAMQWPEHSNQFFLLENIGPGSSVLQVDAKTAQVSTTLKLATTITSFSADALGDEIIFSTSPGTSPVPESPIPAEFGYALIFGKGLKPQPGPEPGGTRGTLGSTIFVARRTVDGHFQINRIDSVLNGLRNVTALTVSPNGRWFTFDYDADHFPDNWRTNPYVRWCARERITPQLLGLYDFRTKTLRMAFDSPGAGWGHPAVWAADSSGFTVNALSPVGSIWEKEDFSRHVGSNDDEDWPFTHTHTFAVDMSTAEITEIEEHPAIWFMDQVLYWSGANMPALLRKNDRTFAWFRPGRSNWIETRDSILPDAINMYSAMNIDEAQLNAASDGREIVGAFETRSEPPDIFVHNLSTGSMSTLSDLNPEVRDAAFQRPGAMFWRDHHGFHCRGFLIKPVGYQPEKRYPLVIMTKTWWSQYFFADTEYHTAFAPQPLVSAGFLVLLAPERPVEFQNDYGRKYPGRFPGQMGEVAELKDIIESARKLLVDQGLADNGDVGIMAFSTTSWKTDVLLTRYKLRFRAASSADSGLWNYGLYWSSNDASVMHASEEYLGGPPYGPTRKDWLKFSPAFNASRVEVPLLMEYTGAGREGIDGLEFFVALRRQCHPADLIFYPVGEHVLDTPAERVASLQRNVDWFRFWMQGYEGPPPAYDPHQYDRWRDLKKELSGHCQIQQ